MECIADRATDALKACIRRFAEKEGKKESFYAFGITSQLDYGYLECAFASEPALNPALRWNIETFRYQGVHRWYRSNFDDRWGECEQWITHVLRNGNQREAKKLALQFQQTRIALVEQKAQVFAGLTLTTDFEVLLTIHRE